MAIGTMPTRPALLLKITDSDGCYGWGEVWANFPPRANRHKADIIEDVVAARLIGATFVEPREIQDRLRESLSIYFLHIGQGRVLEHILAGIDTALWDLALRKAGQTLAGHLGQNHDSAPAYVSSINAGDLDRLIPVHADLGQSHFKLKIGHLNGADRSVIEHARSLIPEGGQLMIDCNQSWDLGAAKDFLASLEDLDLAFAEEALPANSDPADWKELAHSTSIPLAGGENISSLDDFLTMADAGMKVLQPDVAKWGGVTGALDLAGKMPDGTLLWPHFMGTAVGQMAALSVTAAVGSESVCEMDVNANPLRTELCGDVLTISEGKVDLPDAPGLVVPPLPSRLTEFIDEWVKQ